MSMSSTTTTTTTPYVDVVQRRWEVFHFHPEASPPPLPATTDDSGRPAVLNYDGVHGFRGTTTTNPAAREMEAGQEDQHWRSFDSSVNAVSFGFVATAILISMFLVMAIFERFLRPNSSDDDEAVHHHAGGGSGNNIGGGGSENGRRNGNGRELGLRRYSNNHKLGFPESPKMSVYSKGVSVLMPGERIPTFIAHPTPVKVPLPVPLPCPPHRANLPTVQQYYSYHHLPPPHHHHNNHNHNNLRLDERHSTTSHGSSSFG